ncbi:MULTISPECIES: tetratricopeptide repeat protein [Streptacidiphilus]|uniref:Tetratricopeptide repeat protein n=1 Tax=Streptacidiphilus cavernicola TaxID=3342716 RepID=A0ABV6USX0_9ACTN|nr:tetratricopeptide repeat protein [Streptacidiphilus jeojiense]
MSVSDTASATAIAGGVAVTGYVHNLTLVQLERQPVSFPYQVGVLPRPAAYFQFREEVAQLERMVAGGGTAVVGPVLSGMGGVGKTQLAAHFARRAWDTDSLDLLVWVTAGTRAAIVDAYAGVAGAVLGSVPADREQAAQQFLAWLQPKRASGPCRWLMVLDDVADPQDIKGLWPPDSPLGRTLITTRRRDDSLLRGRSIVRVELFTQAQAVTYLSEALATGGRGHSTAELAGLAADLGYLPLALSQAAAYLVDAALDVGIYRDLLADQARRLPNLLPRGGQLPDDQTLTVAAAWTLSLNRADLLHPQNLARAMLDLVAMLDPNGIPERILTSKPARDFLAFQRRAAATDSSGSISEVSADDAVAALRALDRLGLIDHTPATPHRAVRVHQLIQRSARDRMDSAYRSLLARTAADALIDSWPGIERDTDLAQGFRANSQVLTDHSGELLWQFGAHHLLFRTGHSLGESGQPSAAVAYHQHMMEIGARTLGQDHRDVLACRHFLALWQGQAGDASGTVAAYEHLLSDQTRVLGASDLDTISTRNNLAWWRGRSGDAAGATASFKALLAEVLDTLGPTHPAAFKARHNFGYWQAHAGDVAGAVTTYEALLSDQVQALGPDDPDTMNTRNCLACSRGSAGDPSAAVRSLKVLLDDRLRVLGPNHRLTLVTRHNLARFSGESGDAAGAFAAFGPIVADRQRVLGPDHPHTLNARSELLRWQAEVGDPAGAAAGYQELLLDRLRVQGPDHPDTLTTRHSLAQRCGEAGDSTNAARSLEGVLADRLRILGPDHPQSLTTRSELIRWQAGAAGPGNTVNAYEELLADRLRALGPDHKDTLATRNDLAQWRGTAEDTNGAATDTELDWG